MSKTVQGRNGAHSKASKRRKKQKNRLIIVVIEILVLLILAAVLFQRSRKTQASIKKISR